MLMMNVFPVCCQNTLMKTRKHVKNVKKELPTMQRNKNVYLAVKKLLFLKMESVLLVLKDSIMMQIKRIVLLVLAIWFMMLRIRNASVL